MATEFADLILDNGGIIRIEYPDERMDEFFESVDNARARRDWWSVGMFDGCKAEYMGMRLDRVDMQRVIGMM